MTVKSIIKINQLKLGEKNHYNSPTRIINDENENYVAEEWGNICTETSRFMCVPQEQTQKGGEHMKYITC
jgi:hypothetical protein